VGHAAWLPRAANAHKAAMSGKASRTSAEMFRTDSKSDERNLRAPSSGGQQHLPRGLARRGTFMPLNR
jgi:hypothetical protein